MPEKFYEIIPIEFKRGSIRENKMHETQLALAAICLREMFPEAKIKRAAIFFTGDRKRKEIAITKGLLERAKFTAETVHKKIQNGMNPKDFPEQKDDRCNGCCFHGLCFLE